MRLSSMFQRADRLLWRPAGQRLAARQKHTGGERYSLGGRRKPSERLWERVGTKGVRHAERRRVPRAFRLAHVTGKEIDMCGQFPSVYSYSFLEQPTKHHRDRLS